jgi:hypothetical protein
MVARATTAPAEDVTVSTRVPLEFTDPTDNLYAFAKM